LAKILSKITHTKKGLKTGFSILDQNILLKYGSFFSKSNLKVDRSISKNVQIAHKIIMLIFWKLSPETRFFSDGALTFVSLKLMNNYGRRTDHIQVTNRLFWSYEWPVLATTNRAVTNRLESIKPT